MRRVLAALGLGCLMLAAPAADAKPKAGAALAVNIPKSRQIDFTSKVNHRRYRLYVAMPYGPKPKGGYPVVYVLDGNYHFATVVEFARGQATFGVLPPAVVVGIGYADDAPMSVIKLRNLDLTTPITAETLKTMPPEPGLDPDNTGGVDRFLKMIETEVKPRIAALASIDAANQALFGHSLGGLAVVRAVMTEPCAFKSFAAISPSLFWDDNAVTKQSAALEKAVETGACAPRVYLAAGGLEQDPKAYKSLNPLTPAQVQAIIDSTRMVDNPRALAERLRGLKAPRPLEVAFEVYPNESHLSEVPIAAAHGLTFLLKPAP